MYRILVVLFFATLLPYQALAQDAPRAEVFGGFQYFRANTGTDVENLDHFNLNGWDASLSGYFNRYIGVTADFSGAYGSPEVFGVPIHTKQHTPSCLDPSSVCLTRLTSHRSFMLWEAGSTLRRMRWASMARTQAQPGQLAAELI